MLLYPYEDSRRIHVRKKLKYYYLKRVLEISAMFENYPKAVRTMEEAQNMFMEFIINYFTHQDVKGYGYQLKYVERTDDILRDGLFLSLNTPISDNKFLYCVSDMCFIYCHIIESFRESQKYYNQQAPKYFYTFIYYTAPIVVFLIDRALEGGSEVKLIN